jgi:threonyl-tRNA synthetase
MGKVFGSALQKPIVIRLFRLRLRILKSMSNHINIQLPDGSLRQVPSGTTPFDIATSISPRLAAAVVVARITPLTPAAPNANEAALEASEESMYSAAPTTTARIVDLSHPLTEDVSLELLKESDPAALKVVRHSAAHVMATAILELFPETKLGHGPATDAGFFYDVYRDTPFTESDLAAIEARMAQVVARDEPFLHVLESREQAIADYTAHAEFMKLHFIDRFTKPGDEISLYKNGAFTDFCRGPHVPSTGRVKAFKVMSIAGAYWLGDENNQQLQRIYGTAFFNTKDLDAHFKHLEEIKARDHRVLGKQLDLYSIQEVAGAGLIFWHPKGGLVRKAMEDWMRDECIRRGYNLVFTPHIMKRELWKISGHEEVYAENMYPPMELDDAEYRLKPMNCPGHILIYKSTPKSYRDLPQRYAELGNVYRYERSGTMHGLLRVRGFTQDDAHIFCTRDQIVSEIEACLDFADAVLKTFGFQEYRVELSTHEPGNPAFIGTPEEWAESEAALRDVLVSRGLPFHTYPGEAAFYGPKIDIKLVDVLGRLWQLSTIQFDFKLPQRFDLEYIGEDGAPHQPVMVHRALFGSVERFFGVLIEHYAGAFPLWLAPVQVALVPISNEKHLPYAESVKAKLEAAGIRVELDASNGKMQSKIRDFGLQKVPFILILGDKEAATDQVSVRVRAKGDEGSVPLETFLTRVTALAKNHSTEL